MSQTPTHILTQHPGTYTETNHNHTYTLTHTHTHTYTTSLTHTFKHTNPNNIMKNNGNKHINYIIYTLTTHTH